TVTTPRQRGRLVGTPSAAWEPPAGSGGAEASRSQAARDLTPRPDPRAQDRQCRLIAQHRARRLIARVTTNKGEGICHGHRARFFFVGPDRASGGILERLKGFAKMIAHTLLGFATNGIHEVVTRKSQIADEEGHHDTQNYLRCH